MLSSLKVYKEKRANKKKKLNHQVQGDANKKSTHFANNKVDIPFNASKDVARLHMREKKEMKVSSLYWGHSSGYSKNKL